MVPLAQAWETALSGFAAWLRAAGQSEHTVRLRLYYVSRFAASRPSGPWSVTATDLAEFLSAPAWAPETRKSARSALRAFYGWAVKAGRATESPAELLPPVRIPRSLPKPTPEQVFARALAVATDRDRLMMLLAGYAGLRRSEIAALRFVDAAGGSLRVRGKGGRVRLVPMHQRVALAITCERELRERGTFGSGYRYGDPATPYLFPGQTSGHMTPGAVGRRLARCLGDYSGHTLRHRFASRAYAGTRDLRAVQELLGHASLVTTQRYVAVPDDALRAAVDAA